MTDKKEIDMKCSFCGKPNTEVQQIVAANDKVCICDECIMGCLDILIYGEEKPLVIDFTDIMNEVTEDEIKDSGC